MKRRSFLQTICAAFVAASVACRFTRAIEPEYTAPPIIQQRELCAEYRPASADWQEYLLDEHGNRENLGTWPPRGEIELGQAIAKVSNLGMQGPCKLTEITQETADWLNEWPNQIA